MELVLPASVEMWRALRVDDVSGVDSSFRDGHIVYRIQGVGAGEAKSLINDILRCYTAIIHVLSGE